MNLYSFKLRYITTDPHIPSLKEYDILLDGFQSGSISFFVVGKVAHVYNVFLDEQLRGNNIIRDWLKSTFKSIIAYDVLVKKETYWASLGEYKLHPNDKKTAFEDIHFTQEELNEI